MRYIFLHFLIIISFRVNSQVASYNLVLFDSCSSSFEYALLYSLEQNGTTFSIFDTLGTIELPTAGTYKLRDDFNFISQDITIESGYNIDTLSTARIFECMEPLLHPNFIGFCCCSVKCHGFQRDYYNNGRLRIEGTFRNGIPRGEIRYYNQNGSLKFIKFYSRNGNLKRTEEF